MRRDTDYPGRVLAWYLDTARPVLQRHTPSRLLDLDDAASRLKQRVENGASPTTIGLFGRSNVGKSSLLNAILVGKEGLLPVVGIGPCTAQATHIRYADDGHFVAHYRGPEWVELLLREVEEEARDDRPGDDPLVDRASGEAGTASALARLLVTGSAMDPAPPSYLIQCLRSLLGGSPQSANAPLPRDAERFDRVRHALEAGRHECRLGNSRLRFVLELADHASGFLAPMTSRLDLGWKSSVLRDGLSLVDLPGVGIAEDPYQEVAQEWVRSSPQAIALVVDPAGVGQDTFELLRSAGIFNQLLEADGSTSADPMAFLVVVTKADSPADTSWRNDPARPWHEHLAEARAKLADCTRAQTRRLMARALQGTLAQPEAAIAHIESRLRVEAVSSTEFAKLIARHPSAPARIESRAQSGLPAFVAAMQEIASAHRCRQQDRTEAAARQLDQRIRATLYVARERGPDRDPKSTAPVVDLTRVRTGIESHAAPVKAALIEVHAAYGVYLRQELPQQIEGLLMSARSGADQALVGDYADALDQLNFQRLLATIRKGGRWNGVYIARDLAERFIGPIIASWRQAILWELRERSLSLAREGIKRAAELSQSLERASLLNRPGLVESLTAQMTAEAESLSELGSESAKALRAHLRDRLVSLLEPRIKIECHRVSAKPPSGAGAKRRLLGHVAQIVEQWIADAEHVVRAVLRDVHQSLADEARRLLERLGDPIAETCDAILVSEAAGTGKGKLSRSEARAVAAALDAAPDPP